MWLEVMKRGVANVCVGEQDARSANNELERIGGRRFDAERADCGYSRSYSKMEETDEKQQSHMCERRHKEEEM